MASLVQAPGSRLANFFAFRRDPLSFMLQMNGVADLVALSSARAAPSYVVNDPECVHELLVTKESSLRKGRSSTILSETLGNGLLTSEGKEHSKQRKLMQPSFHLQQIQKHADTISDLAQQATQNWTQTMPETGVRSVSLDLMELTLRVITATMFGDEVGERARVLGEAVDACIRYSANKLYAPFALPTQIPTPAQLAFRKALRMLHGYLYAQIEEASVSSPTLLSMLLQMRTDEGQPWMSKEEIRNQLLTIFIAGHETTANALAWSLYLLAGNPDIQQKWHAEVDAVLPGRLPTLLDLGNLALTQQILQETLRLYPTAWMILREADQDVEIGGHSFRRHSTFLISPYAIQRSPDYFTDPDVFRPSRFAGEEMRRVPRYAYFPFGGGSRACIGSQFAQMEAALILAVLGQRFSFSLLSEKPAQPEPSVSLRIAGGLRLRLTQRY